MKNSISRIILLIQKNIPLTLLILFAAIIHLSIILPSGSYYCFNGHCGDYYWGVHEHDGIWHMAVAESAYKTYPPRNPIFAGATLSRYNSLLDFVLFAFSLLGISPFIMYFKILPFVWFVFFTYIAILLGKKISNKNIFQFSFLFLSYFGASFSFLIPLIREHTIKGTSSMLAMQSVLTLTNIQLAFSYIFLFWILILLYEKKITTKQLLTLCFLIFIQWGLKFYAGFVSTVIVGVVFLVRLIQSKKMKHFVSLLLIMFSSIISLIVIYNPIGQIKSGGAPFSFNPLALVWPLIEDPSLLYSYYWSNAKYTLLASSKISPRLILLMTVLVFTFIFLNLGPRIIGLFLLIKKSISKKRKDIDIGILIGICLSLIFSIFFVQRGVWWNTVQFLFLIFLLLNIYTAEFIAQIKNEILGLLILILIMIISIPYAWDALKGYIIYPGVINVSNSEKKALSYLRELPDGVVYAPLYKRNDSLNIDNKIPLFNHVDSSYISAYTGKQTLYANYGQLELLNVNYQERKKQIEKGDCYLILKINYVYFHDSQNKDVFLTKCIYLNTIFKEIYSSNNFYIYSKIK